ncbi:MAG: septum site-determining protein MinC [Clostridia bacterium]|nr:septum site-determining protein MinC [Clostridia bacterium]
MDEIIRLKGTGDGVKIYIAPNSAIAEVIAALREKLGEYRSFFGNGKCNVYFIGENLTESDRIRLTSIAKTMLPEVSVSFGEKRLFKKLEKLLEKESTEEAPTEPKPYIPTLEEVIATNFKHNRARFFEGVVKPGKRVESDSHMILVGDVMKGGEVCASGNVIIFGRLMGNAIAGAGGSRDAYILALDFSPENIAITDIKLENMPQDCGIKKAKLINNEIFVEEFLLNI